MSTVTAQQSQIPRPILIGAGVLLAVTLLAVGGARLSGATPSAMPPVAAEDERQAIVLTQPKGGGILALDPGGETVLAELKPGEDGFVRGVLRALHRIRTLNGVPHDAPVEVVRWADGRHSLIDPATGWRVELTGFGQTNLQTFATLLSEVAKEN